jgi:tetratricopeptide (TPR) repeat protein
VLLLSVLGVILLFLVTGSLTRLYHVKEKSLAQYWFAQGDRELAAGRAGNALTAFRTALVYSPDDSNLQLHLAEALAAAGRIEEARAYLLQLLEEKPGSGRVNLELGRIAARENNVSEAVRAYHNAIYGVWEKRPLQNQLNARLELYKFLRGKSPEADAELLELAANAPPEDGPLHAELGRLFFENKNYERAFAEYQRAVRVDPRNEDPRNGEALSGAGSAAFELGDYRNAEIYLAHAHRENRDDVELARMLETSRLVLANDPYGPGLPRVERARRAARAFEEAFARLKDCARERGEDVNASPQTEMQAAYARAEEIRREVTERNLLRNPDRMTDAMDLAFEMEQLSAQQCGEPQGLDQALLLIGKMHRGAER